MRTKALILLFLGLAACGQPGATTSTPSPGTGVEVVMTATPITSGEDLELCPPGMVGRCPGVILEGDLPPEMVSPPEGLATVVTITGWYDGNRLVPSGPAQLIDDYEPFYSTDFSSKCPDLQGAGSPDQYVEAITAYTQTVPGSFAGMWWDQTTQVMTVWFVGEDIETHRQAITEAVGDQPVCVAGGARFSEAELMEAMDFLGGLAGGFDAPLVTPGFGVDTINNRINLAVQEIDAATRRQIAGELGERVALYPYMELVDASLSDLPEPIPAVPGNVDLLTSRFRYGGGMDALGQFTVGYDSDLNCIYFDGSEAGAGGRTVPVWPFGYSAINDPVEIYDYDGNFIAGQSTQLELGGGFVDTLFVEGNTCGAASAWIVNG